MEIRQLMQFLVVVETGSFKSAAEQLYISRPAVSKAISKLENELNVVLFERHTSGVTLTETGRRLLSKVRSVVDAYQELEKEIQDYHGLAKTLRIGLTYGLENILMDKLSGFESRHPDTHLEIISCTYDESPRLLDNHQLDVIFSGIWYGNPKYTSIPIYCGEVYYGVRQDSHIISRGYILEEEIQSMPLYIPQGGLDVKSDQETILKIDESGNFIPDDYPYHYTFNDNMFFLLRLAEQGNGAIGIVKDAIPESVQGISFVPCRPHGRYWMVQAYLLTEYLKGKADQLLKEITSVPCDP